MDVPFLELRRQVAALRPELDEVIQEVLDSGRFLHGEVVQRFERGFADWCGARHAVAVASGTDALALALQALGVGVGDEVVTAANTCVPTVAAIEQTGATPVLADVDPETWTLDPESFEAVCTDRTRAVVPVHLYGRCADMDAIVQVARPRSIVVVEDAAQAHGAGVGARRAGTLGDAAAFSFYPTKNLGALGDGGAVVTNRDDTEAGVRMLASYGESERYLSTMRGGRNSRLDTLQAAVLSAKLAHLDAWNARRTAFAERYRAAFSGSSLVLPADQPSYVHAWHLFVVLTADRDRFRSALTRAGVDTLVHYARAIHQQPAYAHLAHDGLGVSERLSRQVVSLPLYPELRDEEADRVIGAVLEAIS